MEMKLQNLQQTSKANSRPSLCQSLQEIDFSILGNSFFSR